MKKKAAKKSPTPRKAAKSKGHAEGSKLSVIPAIPLFDRVATILDAARSSVVRAVNSRMVLAYWLIGREIVQDLQSGDERAEYGKRVISELSAKLTQRYGAGYSAANLWLFRQFYQVFQERQSVILNPLGRESEFAPEQILDPLGRESETSGKAPFRPQLSWSHYRAIMRVEKPHAREFYENECGVAGWTKRELERQIHSLYYERLLLSKDKQGMIQEQRAASPGFDPAAILKSSTVLEFLGLPDSPRLHESRLEQAIMDNLQTFLLELGRGFSFVARQRRLLFGDEEFYVDLVFYNYLLKCFVLIDLKMGKLTHQDIGQMDGYVRMYEDLYKVDGDNPTIGLILCTEKSQTIARYSVLQESQQLFASKYRLHLPTEEELAAELKREVLAIQEGRAG
jgi:predicted nuclease of restriction endonuclease-like (RecB) superfamily